MFVCSQVNANNLLWVWNRFFSYKFFSPLCFELLFYWTLAVSFNVDFSLVCVLLSFILLNTRSLLWFRLFSDSTIETWDCLRSICFPLTLTVWLSLLQGQLNNQNNQRTQRERVTAPLNHQRAKCIQYMYLPLWWDCWNCRWVPTPCSLLGICPRLNSVGL